MNKNKKFIEELGMYIDRILVKFEVEEKSINTIKSYTYTYKSFLLFLEDYEKDIDFETIKETDIYAFIEYRNAILNRQGNLSKNSIQALVTHLRILFRFIEKNANALYDFTKVFEDINIKSTKKKPIGLTKDETKKLLDFLSKQIKNNKKFENYRNSFLIKLMLFGGLRVSEALSISLSNIREIRPKSKLYYEISFIGKGNKERYSIIPASKIKKEISYFKKKGLFYSNPIALSSLDGETKLTRSGLFKIVNRYYKTLSIDVSGLHILRHTFAKKMLQDYSLNVVQSLLGHRNIQTTSIYTDETRDEVVRKVTK